MGTNKKHNVKEQDYSISNQKVYPSSKNNTLVSYHKSDSELIDVRQNTSTKVQQYKPDEGLLYIVDFAKQFLFIAVIAIFAFLAIFAFISPANGDMNDYSSVSDSGQHIQAGHYR